MAETAPAPAPAPRPKLSGFEQVDARVKGADLVAGELLDRIQRLKLEVQNWRSTVETQVKTCQNELQELKNGLVDIEVERLKSEIKDIKSAIEEEKGGSPAQFANSEKSNGGRNKTRPTDTRPSTEY